MNEWVSLQPFVSTCSNSKSGNILCLISYTGEVDLPVVLSSFNLPKWTRGFKRLLAAVENHWWFERSERLATAALKEPWIKDSTLTIQSPRKPNRQKWARQASATSMQNVCPTALQGYSVTR